MMKKLFIMLVALCALALPKAAQAVDTEGLYVGGLAGFNWLNNSKDSHEDFKIGWIGGLNLGYRMCSGIRASLWKLCSYRRCSSRDRIDAWEKLRPS
jgi:opacity protein-like surface antigen